MKKIFFITIIVSTVLLAGCDKYLDIQPKGITIPTYYNDYLKLLNSQNFVFYSAAYPAYITDDVRQGEIDDVSIFAKLYRTYPHKNNLYVFAPGQIFLQNETDPLYEEAYKRIFTYNTVINNVMNVPDGKESERRQLKAEALVGRAFDYFALVNSYASHYDEATASSTLGVPLVLSEDINKPYIRNTVAEVYAQIKKDLDEAVPDLATVAANSYRPQKSVGYAFLSKMYLYMGRYQDALNNANEALKVNKILTDYKLYTTKENVMWGRICLITNNTTPFPDPQFNPEAIWARNPSGSSSYLNGEVYATDDLLDVYKQDLATGAVDKRRTLFFLDGSAKFNPSPAILFPGRVLYAPWAQLNFGLGTPELYLIAAECEARIGSKELALQHLNTLRNARISGNVPLTASSNEDALRMALRERRREMAFLGPTRLIDLKRLNKDSRFAKTVTHLQDGKTLTLPPNDNRYILPLPPKVVDFNPSLPQYER